MCVCVWGISVVVFSKNIYLYYNFVCVCVCVCGGGGGGGGALLITALWKLWNGLPDIMHDSTNFESLRIS